MTVGPSDLIYEILGQGQMVLGQRAPEGIQQVREGTPAFGKRIVRKGLSLILAAISNQILCLKRW